ncbi:MAG: cell division protein ZapA [Burkholderiales bacterium]|jgi:cell division protein ZapA|nr:cell division protein ZapA [Burkholderiales bacterium]
MEKKINEPMQALEVRILGRPFKVAYKEGEKDALVAAARLLDENMKKIHDANPQVSIERVAVIAALNFANDLLQLRHEVDHSEDVAALEENLKRFEKRIDQALG